MEMSLELRHILCSRCQKLFNTLLTLHEAKTKQNGRIDLKQNDNETTDCQKTENKDKNKTKFKLGMHFILSLLAQLDILVVPLVHVLR